MWPRLASSWALDPRLWARAKGVAALAEGLEGRILHVYSNHKDERAFFAFFLLVEEHVHPVSRPLPVLWRGTSSDGVFFESSPSPHRPPRAFRVETSDASCESLNLPFFSPLPSWPLPPFGSFLSLPPAFPPAPLTPPTSPSASPPSSRPRFPRRTRPSSLSSNTPTAGKRRAETAGARANPKELVAEDRVHAWQ